MNGFISRATRPLALGCAAAAVLVGGAQAARPDDRAGSHGAGSVGIAPDLVERAVRLQAQAAAAPDLIERAVLRQAAATARPDDRAGVRTISPIEPRQLAVTNTGGGSGFQWNDAGIGAGTALILVLGAGLVLVQYRRHRPVLH